MLPILAQFHRPILAQARPFFGWSLGELLIAVVIIAACVALVYVALRQFEIEIPRWMIQVFRIIIVALVIIFAIRLVLSF
jgi:hypothetical protein